jgi:hypothetical protein
MTEAYQYAVWRVVPDAQRGEAVNVAVVLYCPRLSFLEVRADLSCARVRALAPAADLDAIAAALRHRLDVAAGGGDGVAAMSASDRFGWLVAPASTLVQPGPVHTGLTQDPASTLDALFTRLVG